MRSVMIMGTGRSGTSLTAGLLGSSGYYMGENQMPATPSNPKGFFESFDIEQINEDIMRPSVRILPGFIDRFTRSNLGKGQFWLARLKPGAKLADTPEIRERVKKEVANAPFCFKDPRFSYTLPVWRPFLPEDTVFLCVFRHPTATAVSTAKQIRGSKLLKHLAIDTPEMMELWHLMHRRILDEHRKQGTWKFIHYNQIIEGTVLDDVERLTGATVDRDFPEKGLNRSKPAGEATPEAEAAYRELCELAGYTE